MEAQSVTTDSRPVVGRLATTAGRALAALILTAGLLAIPTLPADADTACLDAASLAHTFTDVPAGHIFCAEIAWMAEAGISNGYPDGTYRPGAAVSRQAMAAFMARLADATLPACTTKPFGDVSTDHPFCAEIAWMDQAGISTGYPDGTYRPGEVVSRQAMAAFMYRLGTCTS